MKVNRKIDDSTLIIESYNYSIKRFSKVNIGISSVGLSTILALTQYFKEELIKPDIFLYYSISFFVLSVLFNVQILEINSNIFKDFLLEENTKTGDYKKCIYKIEKKTKFYKSALNVTQLTGISLVGIFLVVFYIIKHV
jgi:hypothetical protein